MCTLICRVGSEPLLAANRDELYARPFSAPRRWAAATPFWAPRDEEEGGTWIGVNANGLVAAITNRSRLEEAPGRASRGHLVAGALARPDLASAEAWLTGRLEAGDLNPCHVLLLHATHATLFAVHDGFEKTSLAPGLHVLSNLHDPDEIDFCLSENAGWDDIQPILADRSKRLPGGYAVNKDAGWRGTVSSALIEPGRRFLFAGGPPDEFPYVEVATQA